MYVRWAASCRHWHNAKNTKWQGKIEVCALELGKESGSEQIHQIRISMRLAVFGCVQFMFLFSSICFCLAGRGQKRRQFSSCSNWKKVVARVYMRLFWGTIGIWTRKNQPVLLADENDAQGAHRRHSDAWQVDMFGTRQSMYLFIYKERHTCV